MESAEKMPYSLQAKDVVLNIHIPLALWIPRSDDTTVTGFDRPKKLQPKSLITMSTAVHRRMLKEYMAIQKNAATRPHLELLEPIQEDNLLHWQAILLGTAESAYEGGKFHLDIVIPPSYPIQPPTIRFTTTICHPNVHFKTGEICLDILKSEWTPSWNLESVCVAISSLLTNPEPSSPLNCDAANLLRCGDMAGYNSLVKMYTALFAMPNEEE